MLENRKEGAEKGPVQPDANNFSYYHEYCRLYLANIVLTSQMKELIAERFDLTSKLDKVSVTPQYNPPLCILDRDSQKKVLEIQQGSMSEMNRHRRFRRTANQIERHYRCPVESCQKSYGSEGSLNQHIKIKHKSLYATMPQTSSLGESLSYYSQQQQDFEKSPNDSLVKIQYNQK